MNNLQLDQTEQALLSELGEVFHTVHSAGWTRIKSLLDELVEEAHEDLIGCNESLEQRGILHMRWQQREAMKRAIENYILDCSDRRKVILEEIAAREKAATGEQYVPDNRDSASFAL